MSIIWKPNGNLDVATEPTDLPQSVSQTGQIVSGAMSRCKNLLLDESGIARTRWGSSKVNSAPITGIISRLLEVSGVRFAFAGGSVYRNEVSIGSGLVDSPWSAIKYNPFNSLVQSVYCTNGMDRKRIEGTTFYEWGIDAPTSAPVLATGSLTGLTGDYKAVYTYCRKEGATVVSESNPSPEATPVTLTDGSLRVTWMASPDTQVTHVRVYRTLANNPDYYWDQDIAIGTLTVDSNTDDGALGDIVAYNHDRLPLNVTFLAGPTYNGILFALVGNRMYFSLAHQPDYWPVDAYVEIGSMDQQAKSVVFYNGQPFALTGHEIYQIQGTGPDTFFPFPLKALTGCTNRYGALGVAGQGIYRFGTDGIYFYSGTDRKLSQANFNPIFRGEDRGDMPGMNDPSNAVIFQFKNKVYFGYADSSHNYPNNFLCYNLDTMRPSYYDWGRDFVCFCFDETNDRVLAADRDGYIWHLEDHTLSQDNSTAIAWEVETKSFGNQTRASYPTAVKYDVNSLTSTGAKGEFFCDEILSQTHVLNDKRVVKKRLLNEGNARRFSLRISGSGPVSIYAAEILV